MKNLKSPQVYPQQKLHKEGITRRPVISSAICHSSKISKYDDYHFQPTVQEIPFYVNDTSDFLQKFKAVGFVTDNFYLASLDVKLLYTQALVTLKEYVKSLSTTIQSDQ